MRALIISIAVAVVSLSVAACGVAEIPGTGANPQASTKDKAGTTSAKVEACAPGTDRAKPEKIDPSSLKACACGAGGRRGARRRASSRRRS